MDSELIFALVRAAELLEAEADSWGNAAGHPERAQAATIRALIADLRAGNLVRREDVVAQERAKIVAWLRKRGDCWSTDDEIADIIAAGTHEGDPQ